MKKAKPRVKRKTRIKKRVFGTGKRPRINVFRSNKHIYAQAIDDEKGLTLGSFSDLNLSTQELKGKKTDISRIVGSGLGKVLKKLKVTRVIFDRAGYKYHGRVKALAEGLRESGLRF